MMVDLYSNLLFLIILLFLYVNKLHQQQNHHIHLDDVLNFHLMMMMVLLMRRMMNLYRFVSIMRQRESGNVSNFTHSDFLEILYNHKNVKLTKNHSILSLWSNFQKKFKNNRTEKPVYVTV